MTVQCVSGVRSLCSSMNAVFVDVRMDYKSCLSPQALHFCIVFSYFAQLLSFSKVLLSATLTFTGAISSITLCTFELKNSRRESTESDMLGFEDIDFINSTLVFSFKHLFWTDTDLASMAGDQFIKDNTEIIRQCYCNNNR